MAFSEVPAPSVLWIAGEGPETKRLRRAFPSSSRVHWLGSLSENEITRRLRDADVLCAPSLFGESFGVVLLEAMAARCVVVASALDGYRAASGGYAQLVPVGDKQALTKSLIAALGEAVSPNAARGGALDRAFDYANGLSMTRLANHYEAIYERVSESRSV